LATALAEAQGYGAARGANTAHRAAIAAWVASRHTAAGSAGGIMAGDFQRRDFLLGSGRIFGLGWLSLHWPAVAAAHQHAQRAAAAGATTLSYLTAAEATLFDAIAAQIVPSDDTPGAREAGAVYFADHACTGFFSAAAPDLRRGLAQFEHDFHAAYPGEPGFAAASPASQKRYLTAVEKTPFFDLVRTLTVLGLLADPAYGGNRDSVGFKLIGFDDTHVFQPPYGYYDRDYPGYESPNEERKP
jgi:gluconate 2-dehydrogenase gamma chain